MEATFPRVRPRDIGGRPVEEQADDAVPAEAVAPNGGKRLRSTIAFPYSSLRDAERVAEELHNKWGGATSPAQLAGGMNASPRGGSFRVKVSTSRTFGVVGVARERISLTPLGQRLVDPQTRARARVEAFFEVPLFKALYEEYKGSLLPPDTGLEQKIDELGVSVKQTAKARQAFIVSADRAGFFKHGARRLVEPQTIETPDGVSSNSDAEDEPSHIIPPVAQSQDLPLPLPELWATLLREGASWSAEKTQEYVETARKLHDLLAKSS